jgi:CRP-like cAMP-binding protein
VIAEELLAASPSWGTLPPRARRELARRGVERRWAMGEVIFAAGDRAQGIHLVLEGRVRVVRDSGTRRQLVHVEGPGGALGEVALFDGERYPATAIAAEPVRGILLPRAAVMAALAAGPETALLLLGRLAARVRTLVDRLDRLTFLSVNRRLARFLLERAEARGTGRMSLGMTQGQLAEELGTVREVVVRELLALRRLGIIRALGGNRFEVLDAERLRALA